MRIDYFPDGPQYDSIWAQVGKAIGASSEQGPAMAGLMHSHPCDYATLVCAAAQSGAGALPREARAGTVEEAALCLRMALDWNWDAQVTESLACRCLACMARRSMSRFFNGSWSAFLSAPRPL